ncbi:MAG: hypothetical protein Q4D16_14745 [Eubacteriales bacterium]|nr:hypothetical protein [Eubacteriales bacterium]
MWKLMFQKSIRLFLKNSAKDLCILLVWALFSLLLFTIIIPVGMAFSDSYYQGVDVMILMFTYPGSGLAVFSSMTILLLSTGMAAYFIKENPIQLPKMMFLIPMDRKTRINYLFQRFFIKLLWLLGGVILYHYVMLGGFFYKKSFIDMAVQLCVFIFTLWSLILKTGFLGITSNTSLEESTSLKEALVNFYWIFFLLLQQILLAVGYLAHIYEKYPAVWLLWMVILGIDVCIAKYCTPEILQKAASYENVYTKA